MSRIGALLDTNVRLSTFTHTWAYTRHSERRGNRFVAWIDEIPKPRILRNKTLEQSKSIYESLKIIAEMSRQGLVTLYESDETLAEFLNFRPAGFGLSKFDVFSGVKIEHARAPIARRLKIDASYTPNDARKAWHTFLAQISHPRFLKLLKRTGGDHAADLYHVWEAEHNGIDAFVTLDVKFVNAVTKPKPMGTPVRICTPSEFVLWIRMRTPAV
jgi:predicted nucleic acid-binding protein